MGLTQGQFLYVSLVLVLVAIGAAFVWGRLVDRYGPKRTLIAVLVSWVVGLLLGVVALFLPSTPAGIGIFVVAGAIVGSGLGGVQVADRVLMIRLSPPRRLGEFFGLYGLVGKGSQVVGQLLYGIVVFLLRRQPRQRRLPDRDPQPARHDGHRPVARLAGQRPLGGWRSDRPRRARRPGRPARASGAGQRPDRAEDLGGPAGAAGGRPRRVG